MNKTLKLASLNSIKLASAGVLMFAVTGTALACGSRDDHHEDRHAQVCKTQVASDDFAADFKQGSVTSAHIVYVGKKPMCDGVTQTISLNAYLTEGPTWETSGKQTFVDHQSVVLSHSKPSADLTVQLPNDCFYQTDLYANGLRYDGTPGQGSIPAYPNINTPEDLLAYRNGGSKVCEGRGGGTPTPTPAPTPSVSPTPTPSVSPKPSTTPTPKPTNTPQVLAAATELPKTGGSDMGGILAMSAGAASATVAYVRARRKR